MLCVFPLQGLYGSRLNDILLKKLNCSESDASVVTCLSNNSCRLYKLNNSEIAQIRVLREHNAKIIGCRFSGTDNNILYTGSSEGTLKVWDIREPKKSTITLTGNKMHLNS